MSGNTLEARRLAGRGSLLKIGRETLFFLLGAVVFGLSYTQPALYYSNQNQYFLHGLARGGCGFLDEDWLANTADPTPLFTTLVAFTVRHLGSFFFYVYYLLILGAYCHALVGISTILRGREANGSARFLFFALFVAIHSALLRWSSAQLFGVDYPWYLQAGVANQYVLGAGLQPSVFGVLLLVSIHAFLRDRPLSAAAWAALAGAMHSTYLLSAAFLTLAYLYCLFREKRIREAFFAAGLALTLVAPVVIYNLRVFAPSSPETFAEAQRLLAHFRLPHHAEPERWLDGIAVGQLAAVVAVMILARGQRLFPILFTPFILSVLVTLIQTATGNDTMALLFPWRSSAILVPLAVMILLGQLVNRLNEWLRPPEGKLNRVVGVICSAALAICLAGGIAISYFDLGYRTNEQELKLLRYVHEHKSGGETYLLPVEVPKLKSGRRGAASLNFTAPPRRVEQNRVISVDLQRFRLFTGAAIFVDFKSIPYKDVEVLEWRRRLDWNEIMYQQRDWNEGDRIDELRRRGITHVVTAVDRDVRCRALELIHADENYRLYRLLGDRP